VQPQGLIHDDYGNLKQLARIRRFIRQPLLFAATTPFLAARARDSFGLQGIEVHSLPNIIDPVNTIDKSPRATVVALGRLDPIKRPWVITSLAQSFPDVEFIFMGQSHFRGPGSWEPRDLPTNVRFLGHVNEVRKKALLSEAWLLVNTSIHEGLCVSFLEALACETPLLACVDPEGIVSRFGTFVGNYSGTGLEAIPALESALRELFTDRERRASLGAEGRAWVSATHNRAKFLGCLSTIWAHTSSTRKASRIVTGRSAKTSSFLDEEVSR
jgi:glycosyltransferase involved in cell wall biosynthesis